MAAFKPISTLHAPKAIGCYSQATCSGNLVFLSGQLGIDPTTQKLVASTIEAEMRQVLRNLQAVAQAAGGDLTNIVKLTVYLKNLSHFPILNEIMKEFFSEPYPARATIEISNLPAGGSVEIDGIIVLNSSS